MKTDLDLCEELTGKLPKLDDAGFARSLINSVRGRLDLSGMGATDKQRLWLQKLIDGADGKGPQGRKKTAIGALAGVMTLFDRARKHLKAPAIVLGFGGSELRLSVAGERARVPGSINVGTNEGYGDSKWFGRILQDGLFEASPREPTPPALIDLLKRFAAEPAKVAAEHGRLTGKCCFCNRGLTDERSIAVGYGATCATHYGLPYPKTAEVRAAMGDLFVEAA